jgi:hypothetical protein
VVRVLLEVTLHLAGCFYFGITVCEETVMYMSICQVSHHVLYSCRVAYIQCCRDFVGVSELMIASGVRVWLKTEKVVV